MTLGFLSGSLGKPKTSLLDRAVNNLSDIAGGFVPGMLEIGHSVGNDVWAAMPGTANNFKTPALGKQMGQAMWSNSALPPLLLGNPGEALKRASARPIDALLDLSLAVPATTGAARLGMKFDLTKDLAAPALGLNKLDYNTASRIKTALDQDAISKLPGTSPSILGFADGSQGFTREFMGEGGIQRFGDDLYGRRTHRTVTPGALPKIENETPAVSALSDSLEAMTVPSEFAKKVPTLDDDLMKGMTNPRSTHETYAQIGDVVTDLLGKIPDNKFGSSARRLGKRMTNTPLREARHDSDRRQVFFDQLKKAAVAEVVAKTGMSPEEAIVSLDNTWLAKAAVKNKEGILSAANDLDASYGLDKIDYAKLMDMTLAEAFDEHGLYFHNKNNWKIADPINNQTRFGDFLKEYEQEITQKGTKLVDDPDNPGVQIEKDDYTSPFELKRLSGVHRRKKKDFLFARDKAYGTAHQALEQLRGRGASVRLTNKLDVNDSVIMTPEELLKDGSINKLVNHDDWNWELIPHDGNPFDTEELSRVLEAAGNPGNEAVVNSLWEALKETASEYNSSRSYVKDLDDLSNYHVNQYRLYGSKPSIEARPDSTSIPVVDRLREIGEKALPEDMWDSEPINELYSFLSETNKQGGKIEQERFGTDLLPDERLEQNVNRFAGFVDGKELGSDATGGDFIKMRKAPGEQDDVYRKNRDPVTKEFSNFNTTEPGDPWKAFLKDDFDGTMQAVLDDFSRNRNLSAGREIFKTMTQQAASMPLSQAMKISNGKAIDEAAAIADKTHAAPYVIVTEDGPFTAQLGEQIKMLDEWKALYSKENPKLGPAIDEMKKMLQGSIVNPKEKHIKGALHDAPSRKKGDVVDDPTVHLMRTEVYRAVTNELIASSKAMNAAWEVGTEIWKYSVLHARFLGWMRNNYIGAQMMLGMNAGIEGYGRELARRYNAPDYKEMQSAVHADMPELFGSGSSEMARNLSRGKKPKWMQKFEDKVIEPMSEFNTKYADNPAREMMLFDNMYKQLEEVQKLRGETGPIDIDAETVERFMNDDTVRGELSRRTRSQMVDFSDMSQMERQYIRAIFPFYAWMKGSSKAMGRLVADKPGTVWGAAQVSEIGTQATEDDYGNFSPEFVDAWWNPGGGKGNVLKTSGMNPYTAFTDSIGMGASLVPNIPLPGTDDELRTGMSYRAFGSENPLSSMHPLLGAGIEALTGKNMFFGTPIEQGSTGGGFVNKLLGGLPGSMYADRFISNKTGPDATTKYGRAIDTANFLAGIPIAQPLPGNVRSRGVDEMNERYQSPLAWRELQ